MDLPGICIVGCGTIAAAHAKRLQGRARLYFCSRRSESAEQLNHEVGGEGVFGELGEALDASSTDAVMITTPPEVHAEQAIAALSADKTVFVEKPMCINGEEIDRIEQVVGTKPLMVGENYYYKPSLIQIKDWIENGDIGKVQQVHVRKCISQPSSGWKSQHGALFEGGIHFVALLNGLLGAPTSVETAEFPGYGDGPERNASVSTLHGQVRAVLDYSWDTPALLKGVLQHSSIEGDRGRIVFESNGIYARLSGKRSCLRFPGFGDMMGAGAMIDDFLETILTGRPPVSDLIHARQDLETVFKAYELGGVSTR